MKTFCKNDIIGGHGVWHGEVKLFWDIYMQKGRNTPIGPLYK